MGLESYRLSPLPAWTLSPEQPNCEQAAPCSHHCSSPAMIDYIPSKHEPQNLLPSFCVSIEKVTTQSQRQTGAWPHSPWSNDANFTKSSFMWTSKNNLPWINTAIMVFIGVSVLDKMGAQALPFYHHTTPCDIGWHPRHHGYSTEMKDTQGIMGTIKKKQFRKRSGELYRSISSVLWLSVYFHDRPHADVIPHTGLSFTHAPAESLRPH